MNGKIAWKILVCWNIQNPIQILEKFMVNYLNIQAQSLNMDF